jgi:hypothetical protein
MADHPRTRAGEELKMWKSRENSLSPLEKLDRFLELDEHELSSMSPSEIQEELECMGAELPNLKSKIIDIMFGGLDLKVDDGTAAVARTPLPERYGIDPILPTLGGQMFPHLNSFEVEAGSVVNDPTFPVWLSSIQTAQPLRIRAQQETESNWPVRMGVDLQAEEGQLSATLEFDWRGPCIVVQQIGALGEFKLILRPAAGNREIELFDARKELLGTLDEFELTDRSPKEEIEAHLKARIAIRCRRD